VLGDRETGANELRLLAMDVAASLSDVRRVAISRGHRLPIAEPSACEGGDEGPQPPAAEQ
jgi:hypothetical protein